MLESQLSKNGHHATSDLARENPSDVVSVGTHADQDFICLRSLSCSDIGSDVLVEWILPVMKASWRKLGEKIRDPE